MVTSHNLDRRYLEFVSDGEGGGKRGAPSPEKVRVHGRTNLRFNDLRKTIKAKKKKSKFTNFVKTKNVRIPWAW